MHEILASDFDRYSEVFDGFTLFTHAAGRYPRTFASISFFMTGRAPDPAQRISFHLSRTHGIISIQPSENIQSSTRWRKITSRPSGFSTAVIYYCDGMYTACTSGRIFDGLPVHSGRTANTAKTAVELLDVALFQVAPLAIRPHIYNDEQWFLRRLAYKTRTYSGILDLFLEKMTTDERPGSYNYFHHAGGHPPIQFDENCNYRWRRKNRTTKTRAHRSPVTLLQLESLVQKLKQLGIYMMKL